MSRKGSATSISFFPRTDLRIHRYRVDSNHRARQPANGPNCAEHCGHGAFNGAIPGNRKLLTKQELLGGCAAIASADCVGIASFLCIAAVMEPGASGRPWSHRTGGRAPLPSIP